MFSKIFVLFPNNVLMPISILDINECSDNRYTCQYGKCSNLPGGWICECKDGFEITNIDSFQRKCDGEFTFKVTMSVAQCYCTCMYCVFQKKNMIE